MEVSTDHPVGTEGTTTTTTMGQNFTIRRLNVLPSEERAPYVVPWARGHGYRMV